MQRIAEPELMDDPAQALAYANADFAEPHDAFVRYLGERFPGLTPVRALDLGCGAGDVTCRFARAYPTCQIVGLDGASSMLALARERSERERLGARIRWVQQRLPENLDGLGRFDAIICNSLLHHLRDPLALWQALCNAAQPGAAIFVMDLRRPESPAHVDQLVATYARDEPELLRRDFRNSLAAAYTLEEIRAQLSDVGLPLTAEAVGDRHVLVYGHATD